MLKEKYSDKPIAIVLDNARYQHCFVVKTIAKSLGIQLLFLPPYSPKLNIIERLWKVYQKEDFVCKVLSQPTGISSGNSKFFNDIHQNFQEELTSLRSL